MKIGIDCRTILNPERGERAGIGHYTYNLVCSMLKEDKKNDYVLFFDDRFGDPEQFQQKNVKIKQFPFYQYKKFLPFSYSHLLISALLGREKLDVYHAPANVIPYMYSGPSVVTVHDLAIYENPEWFPRGQKISTTILVPQSIKKAKRIIAVSEHTKKKITSLFSIPASRVSVIHEGVVQERTSLKPADVFRRHRIREPYILFIGTLEPRKNIIGLVQAFKNLADEAQFKDYRLVIAGQKGWKHEGIFKAMNQFGISRRIRYIGYVNHDEKVLLMRRATCFVFPSYHEGFGLPVLEALSAGTPVITSNTSSIPEVAGKAALLIDPNSPQEIHKALRRVLRNASIRQRMIRAGRRQASQFTWGKTARETIALYERVRKATTRSRKSKR